MTYDERMAEIMRRDNERRTAQELVELVALSKPRKARTVVDPYHYDRQITGEPTERHRVHKASSNSWDRMANPRWSDVTLTMADGSSAVAPASIFRKGRGQRRQAQQVTQARHHMTAADMAPVQDYENDN
jgi:hypothetical protein